MAVAGVLHRTNIEGKKFSVACSSKIEGMIRCLGPTKKSGTTRDYHMLCLERIHPTFKALEGRPEAALGGHDRTCLTRFLSSDRIQVPCSSATAYSDSQMDKKSSALSA